MSKRALPAFLFLACSLVAAQSSATLEGKSTRLTLLSALSSKSPKASEFRARLEESVQVDGEVLLPQGTLFEGHVEPRPARRMIRSGALRLVFDRMVLPDGTVRFTNTSLTSIDYKGVKTDSEGTVRPRLSKKRLLVQVGGALLIAKVGDDLSEVAIATVTKQPKFIQLMVDNGMEILSGSPDEFKATIQADRKKWSEVIQAAKIRVD